MLPYQKIITLNIKDILLKANLLAVTPSRSHHENSKRYSRPSNLILNLFLAFSYRLLAVDKTLNTKSGIPCRYDPNDKTIRAS